MIGVYDFCGHYEWTFAWLEAQGGQPLVDVYWEQAIYNDSQRHAAVLIENQGIEGMKEYWGHTLSEEQAGYTSTATSQSFGIEMHDCPSKGFLIKNGLAQYSDYCDHCIGWIGPLMDKAGFSTFHEHNHCGQCRWQFQKKQRGESEGDNTDDCTNEKQTEIRGDSKDVVVHRFIRK